MKERTVPIVISIVVAMLAFLMLAGVAPTILVEETKLRSPINANAKEPPMPTNGDSRNFSDQNSTSNGDTLNDSSEGCDKVTPATSSEHGENADNNLSNDNPKIGENVSIPDGRIYMNTDSPYAYIPTCSQKEPKMPIVP